jgi:hypothetical protein
LPHLLYWVLPTGEKCLRDTAPGPEIFR